MNDAPESRLAELDLIAAACGLDRGGKRGAGTHVSITVASWERLVLARRRYAASAEHDRDSGELPDDLDSLGTGNPIRSTP
jgi:hypothetical protein